MTFMERSPIHMGLFSFLLWCNSSALAGSKSCTVSQRHLCMYNQCNQYNQYNHQQRDAVTVIPGHCGTKSFQLRGGYCPDEGVESQLSTAAEAALEGDEASDKDDAKDDATLAGQEDEDFRSDAAELRLAGKDAHDKGDFELAAELFQNAADSLQNNRTELPSEEYATCRLHQALCYLKSEKYDECLEACSDILESEATHTSAVRARAYHRRAKAKLALNDHGGALLDARSAAFLGDRKAVALYGRLMRETSSSFALPVDGSSGSADSMSSLASPSAALLESLMSKSSPIKQNGNAINPISMLFGGEKNSLLNSLGGSDGNSLAKSVITSLSKRLDDESTHSSISAFLKKTNKVQLQNFASMAGMAVPETVLDHIERACHGITPKKIRRMLKTTKAAVYAVRIARRISRLLQKYKSLLVVLVLFQWTKSAILRPMPVDRALAKRQAKAALKEGMKANRAGSK